MKNKRFDRTMRTKSVRDYTAKDSRLEHSFSRGVVDKNPLKRARNASRSVKHREGINVHNDWSREYRLQLLGAYPCYTVVPLCNTVLTEESYCDLISGQLGLAS